MHACHFCGRPCTKQWAVAARNGDLPNVRWRREVLPICPRCNRSWTRADAMETRGRRQGSRLTVVLGGAKLCCIHWPTAQERAYEDE